MTGEHDHGKFEALRLHLFQRFKPVDAPHLHIEKAKVNMLFVNDFQGFFAMRGFKNAVVFEFEDFPQGFADTLLIIYKQRANIDRLSRGEEPRVGDRRGRCGWAWASSVRVRVE